MASIVKTGNTSWENRHQTFTEKISDFLEMWNASTHDILNDYNDMTAAIQSQIANLKANGQSMRALGGGWSWTKIATPDKGTMFSTRYLNNRFTVVPSIVPAYRGNADDLLFVQCGMKLFELNYILERKNKSLKTSGASNGQTIVGALSTGTHGSAFEFGAIPEFVVGIHLITGPAPEDNIWLERKSVPVGQQAIANLLNARFIGDDELFNAALVSFGSFGFIHGVMIETEPLYLLECYRRRTKDYGVLFELMRTLSFDGRVGWLPYPSEKPHHFQVTLNPHDMLNGAYVTTMYKRPYTTNYDPPDFAAKTGIGEDIPAFIGTITDALPGVIGMIVNGVIGNQYPLFENQLGTRGEIFGDTELRGKLLSAAIGLSLNDIDKVRTILLQLNETGKAGPFAGVFAFRFVKASGATLGFTHFAPYTCVLELDGVYADRILQFYEEVWTRLDQENIPFTFHWGKMTSLTADRLASGYGDRARRWQSARQELMKPEMMRLFDNPQIRQWGLA